MKQLARLAQELFPLRATELVRRHGPHEAMTRGAGIVLLDQLASLGQRRQLAAQPTQHPPERHVMQGSFLDGRRASRRLITRHAALRAHCLTIRLPVVLHVGGREI